MNTKTKEKPSTATEPPRLLTPGVLLNAAEVAARLSVPESWIREKCRERARLRDADPFPTFVLGKYRRFRWSDVEKWLERQNT